MLQNGHLRGSAPDAPVGRSVSARTDKRRPACYGGAVVQDLVYRLVVVEALKIRGVEALSAHLGVQPTQLDTWEKGLAPVPVEVFLRLVDILSDHSARAPSRQTRLGSEDKRLRPRQ